MKQQTKITVILISLLTFLTLPALTQAADELRLFLSAEQLDLQVGQQAVVEVMVEGANSVYGAEFHLRFDPAKLEVVELGHGDFLSSDPENEAFVLQNEANNEAGTIDYAVSLLNPAPPVEGNGLLLSVVFQAKVEGPATIQFEDGLFGTQTGEEIVPLMENAEITITPGFGAPQNQAAPQTSEQSIGQPRSREQLAVNATNESDNTLLGLSLVLGALVIVIIGLVGLLGVIGVWFWLGRSRQNKRPRGISA